MKKALVNLLLAGCFLCLSGCFFQSADELYALPRSSERYVNLQAEIRRVMGGAEYNTPLMGNNTQPIQLVDLNNDGVQEAVAFFRDPAQEKPLKIYIFAQNAQGDYQEYAHIEGAATDIESIDYLDLGGSADLELLVSWQVSASVHTLVSYRVEQGQTAELMRSGYTSYQAMDLNGNGKNEILLVQTDSAAPESNRVDFGNRVEYFVYRDGAMDLVSAAPLSQGCKEIADYQSGCLAGGQPAFFVTSTCGETEQLTDIFTWAQGKLHNITLETESGQSGGTRRQYTGVPVQDIDGDGVTEIPLPRKIPSYTAVSSENFWEVRWWQYAADGSAALRLTTYHNYSDRWYLELPPAWEGAITLSRQENTAIGERAVVFSHWNGAAAEKPEDFLVIYRLTGTSRQSSAEQAARFPLLPDGDVSQDDVTYAGELLAGSWNCGLTQSEVTQRFHLIRSAD